MLFVAAWKYLEIIIPSEVSQKEKEIPLDITDIRDLKYSSNKHIYEIETDSQTKGEGNGIPLQYSCLENPMDVGAWWAAVHGVTNGQI